MQKRHVSQSFNVYTVIIRIPDTGVNKLNVMLIACYRMVKLTSPLTVDIIIVIRVPNSYLNTKWT